MIQIHAGLFSREAVFKGNTVFLSKSSQEHSISTWMAASLWVWALISRLTAVRTAEVVCLGVLLLEENLGRVNSWRSEVVSLGW